MPNRRHLESRAGKLNWPWRKGVGKLMGQCWSGYEEGQNFGLSVFPSSLIFHTLDWVFTSSFIPHLSYSKTQSEIDSASFSFICLLKYRYVASITNGTTDRQDKYLVSLISTLVASHFNSGYRTIITVYESVSENV